MDPFEKQKEMRRAMNARMSLIVGGLFLIFTAVTSTLMYGINFFIISSEASKGNAEYMDMIEQSELSISMMQLIGGCFLTLCAAEIVFGIFIFRFSNRVDKAKTTRKIVLGLLAAELAMQIFLFCMRLTNLGMLFTAVVIPLILLWGTIQLIKLAKADPNRVYAVQPSKGSVRRGSAKKQAVPEKSLRERAMMKAQPPEEKPAVDEQEIDDSVSEDQNVPDEE